jgi:MAF protein
VQLTLASTSPYRAELLERLGLPFATMAPEVDEAPLSRETPDELVVRLSLAKARAVAKRQSAGLVIGSDQVAVLDGQVLGKPGTMAAARAQLGRLSGREVRFLTGLAVVSIESGRHHTTLVETPVWFRALSEAEITGYVDRERPLDCAGAFKSEGLGVALFERIGGPDPSALIGLPLIELCRLLAEEGVSVLVP